MRQTSKATVRKARALRRAMTPPEAKLWNLLRARPADLKFRHQHPAGPYVFDFYCASAKLGIEIDGIAHEMGDNPALDEKRDQWLRNKGYRILRIPAIELKRNAEGVLQHILNACAK
jgi:very-short-patch-repair endonuclease